MAVALPISPETIISTCIAALSELKERIEIMKDNKECRRRIVRKVEEVEAILQKLRRTPSIDASKHLESLEQQLQKCLKTCNDLRRSKKAVKLFNARERQDQLVQLEQDLRDAVDMATLALTACVAVRAEENHDLLRGDVSALHHDMGKIRQQMENVTVRAEENHDLLREDVFALHHDMGKIRQQMENVAEKQEGVFPCASKDAAKTPGPVSKPNVGTQGNFLVIEWKDSSKKRKKSLTGYTVQYNDHSTLVEPSKRTLKLEPPAIEVGKSYTIRVRAISKTAGPGQWSEQTEVYYNSTTCDSLKDQLTHVPAVVDQSDQDPLAYIWEDIDSQDTRSPSPQDSVLDPSFYKPSGSPSPDAFRRRKYPSRD